MLEYTFSKLSTGDYSDKGSSLHSVAQIAAGLRDVKSQLFNLKEKYPDATHIYFTY